MPCWITVKEAAARLGVAPDWIYKRIRRDALPIPLKRRGRHIRIPADEFERWANQEVIG